MVDFVGWRNFLAGSWALRMLISLGKGESTQQLMADFSTEY